MAERPEKPEEATPVGPIDMEKNTSAIHGDPESQDLKSFDACYYNGTGYSPGAAIIIGNSYYICKYDPGQGRGWWERDGQV